MSDFTKGCIAAVVCVGLLVGAPTACTMHANAVVAEGVAHGANPLAMSCAVVNGASGNQVCAVLAAKEAK